MNFTLHPWCPRPDDPDDTHEATSAGRQRARFDESNRTPCRNRQSTVAPALLPSGPVGSQRRGEHLHAGRCSRPVRSSSANSSYTVQVYSIRGTFRLSAKRPARARSQSAAMVRLATAW